MSNKPGDWWDRSWNVVTGCSWPEGEVPAGCEHCWAAGMARRFPHIHATGKGFGEIVLHTDRLDIPRKTKKPTVFSVPLLGDLFHPEVPMGFSMDVLEDAWQCNFDRSTIAPGRPVHRFVLLTKRWRRAAEVMRHWVAGHLDGMSGEHDGYMDDTILMASVWDQESTDEACAAFASLPAGVRWGLHMEPLLGPVDFGAVPIPICGPGSEFAWGGPLTTASWIVVGAENGPGARPMEPDWARHIRDQCAAAEVPFWLKSLGRGKGRELDGVEHNEVPWRGAT